MKYLVHQTAYFERTVLVEAGSKEAARDKAYFGDYEVYIPWEYLGELESDEVQEGEYVFY